MELKEVFSSIRTYLYTPKIIYSSRRYPKIVYELEELFDTQCIAVYKIPNALVPQLHTSIILFKNILYIYHPILTEDIQIPLSEISKLTYKQESNTTYAQINTDHEQTYLFQYSESTEEFFQIIEKSMIQKENISSQDTEIEEYIDSRIEGLKKINNEKWKQMEEENNKK